MKMITALVLLLFCLSAFAADTDKTVDIKAEIEAENDREGKMDLSHFPEWGAQKWQAVRYGAEACFDQNNPGKSIMHLQYDYQLSGEMLVCSTQFVVRGKNLWLSDALSEMDRLIYEDWWPEDQKLENMIIAWGAMIRRGFPTEEKQIKTRAGHVPPGTVQFILFEDEKRRVYMWTSVRRHLDPLFARLPNAFRHNVDDWPYNVARLNVDPDAWTDQDDESDYVALGRLIRETLDLSHIAVCGGPETMVLSDGKGRVFGLFPGPQL